MEQELDKSSNFINKIKFIFKKNKILILSFILISLSSIISIFIYFDYQTKKNIDISEKYIKANHFFINGQTEKAKNKFREIILSNNKFYSLLALNMLIEKKLVNNKDEVFEYFQTLEKKNFSEEYVDLIQFKKALYLLKLKDFNAGQKILNNLISKNSKLKSAAQEIIN